MKRILLACFCVVTVVFCSYGQEQQLDVVWDDGLKFIGRDGAYDIRVGGRLHYDISFLKHDEALDERFGVAGDKVEVRRARISLQGTIRNAYEYEFDVSFEDGLEFNDMQLSFLKVPLLDKLTLGHFREPYGMEENTSSNSIPLMERSLASAFGPSRNAGIMVQRHFYNGKLGMYAGAFRITDDLGSDREAMGKYSFSTRLALAPLLDTTMNRAIHLGISLNTQSTPGNVFVVESQNESNTAPAYISSGELENVARVWKAGVETGFVKGPFTLQSEYMHAYASLSEVTNQLSGSDYSEFRSYYVQGTYFLFGGSRQYDVSDNTFSDINLRNPNSLAGALEVALRFSHLNLLNSPQEFKEMDDIVLGLNYYLNESVRLMGNYIFSRIEEEHHAQVLQFRMQVSF